MNNLLSSRTRSSSRSPSRSSSRSRSADPRTGPDHARIAIQLENGRRFMVFVPQDATIGDLHEEALQRASRFGIDGTTESTEIQTIGRSPLTLFPEDPLQDMISETENNTFKLCCAKVEQSVGAKVLANSSKIRSNTSVRDDLIFIRWITLEDSLLNSRISSIKVDHAPMLRQASLSKLYGTAVDKYLNMQPGTVDTQISLYIKDCYISAEHNPVTLNDLGLHGTRASPLDIFVDILPKTNNLTLATIGVSTSPSALWGFKTTRRGVCTFTSCLDMLDREMSRNPIAKQDFLQNVLETVHFPPLVLAFAQVFASDWKAGKEASSLRMIAYALHHVCTLMRPSAPEDSALEASRQAFAWFRTIPTSQEMLSNDTRNLLNDVKILQSNALNQMVSVNLPFNHVVDVQVRSAYNSIETKTSLVALDCHDDELARLLAHCLTRSYRSTGEYYLRYRQGWSNMVNHRRRKLPSDFESLLKAANSPAASVLNMIGPLQLGTLAATALPVLTLGPTGYVSVYDQEDYDCSQKQFFLWNIIQGKEVMQHANPGPYLAQKLEALISARNADGTFGIDAWNDVVATAHFGVPTEAIVVCLDISGSMAEPMPVDWAKQDTLGLRSSRLTESKELFKSLATRIAATKSTTHLGLVTFSTSDRITVVQCLTGIHLDFEDKVETLRPKKKTAVFDGLRKASEMLVELKARYTDCRLRIIALTDGQDNASTISSSALAQELFDLDIVLDSIVIETKETGELFRASRVTGGYAFACQTREVFFQIPMLETMVEISRRPDVVKAPFKRWNQFQPKPADMQTIYEIPPCRPHPNQNDDFIALESSVHYWKRRAKVNRSSSFDSASISSSTTASSMSRSVSAGHGNTRVILNEIQAVIDHYHHAMDVYISESNMTFWLVVMEGPAASAYEGGTFLCYLDLSNYPSKAPEARFVHPILHPNVTKHGKICHPIFDREFTPDTQVFEILQHIWGLLMSLEIRDAIDPMLTLKSWTDPTKARKQVQDHVRQFAALSRKQHRLMILREDMASILTARTSSDTDSTASLPSVKRPKY